MNEYATCNFFKSLNHRNIDKSVSDIRIRIRFPFESSFRISVSGFKLTILPDIQPANRIVIISAANQILCAVPRTSAPARQQKPMSFPQVCAAQSEHGQHFSEEFSETYDLLQNFSNVVLESFIILLHNNAQTNFETLKGGPTA